ncbi:MAG: DUF433 domain-containing protein [Phycisphaerales bacterium]|nr:DUF433 domain-containing protein [Phycisphaerales bacterium]
MSAETEAVWVSGPVWSDPERMGGVVCFNQTRVPVRTLFDYLSGNHSIEEFLDDFPPITRDQVDEVLSMAGKLMSRANAA